MGDLIQTYVTRQAESAPERPAIAMGAERLTYGELELASDRLSAVLLEGGLREDDRVCLLMPKSPAAIVAMLGTLKAGGAYVPLDIASPAARVARILASAEPALLIAAPDAAALLEELLGALPSSVGIGTLAPAPAAELGVPLRFTGADVDAADARIPPREPDPARLAHLLFTSGSTGDPKGVGITHANVTSFVDWAVSHFGMQASDRVSSHPPLHFDLSTFDIYGSFAAGAELHLVPPGMLLSQQLATFISESRLTHTLLVPSTMTYMAKTGAVPDDGFPSLERVLWCGEVLPTPVLIHWMTRVRQATFTNLYGPTEATIASSYYTVGEVPSSESEPIPIGTPCPGEELVVLDEQGRTAPAGEPGELHIGGVGLSPGYWRDEAKTAAAFIPDPRPGREGGRLYRTGDLARSSEEGLFHFLGRADSQIKSRGYRIELGEIEAALNAIAGIRECAAVGVPTDGFEGTVICCAYALADGAQASPADLRRALTTRLPSYMLPTRWEAMATLPKNVNGKIDRRAIRESFEAPRSAGSGSR